MKMLMAMGKWSKADKRWNVVVALRRPSASTPASPPKRAEPRRNTLRWLRPPSEA